ncbi:geranylgeranylglyceryl/heptaprenylglyceryl phosphate synthase [Chitinophaga pendula]|uniref:geranylgeranylglyceryl/heptaprenylglyceryl phosphate synthase n=1 Tax=Chitinophaga TaxID=79328 RepID=UPI000BB01C68|nr:MULTISPECIES: geranylgeranylglyceryl/heptaprenylglyceryl phosphate synthase [Chitinophaga]ASZ09976.1 geranylgeranylglyceryl/heptaprenylglyceryl phosphate synthase [Chitinophaga sp. MD30]UCJ07082.1 geranylgeranylglyceryl/heptaprenylglyceryl phosphate synthase [Chitinophaga pendula]
MSNKIYNSFLERKAKGIKSFAVLIDPDKVTPAGVIELAEKCTAANVDYIFLGGSLVITQHLDECVQQLKSSCDIPVVLFPGSPSQVSRFADALLYLSVISGRNPELLIGQHVVSAAAVKKSGLEVISTGYMVVDGGAPTTVSYISNTTPIPADKDDIAMCTAMAGEMLGMKVIYMDAGSGARKPITESMISRVSSQVSAPVIVGGGIRDAEKAYLNCKAGADIIVVGNAIEKDLSLIKEVADAVHTAPVNV